MDAFKGALVGPPRRRTMSAGVVLTVLLGGNGTIFGPVAGTFAIVGPNATWRASGNG